MSIRYVTLNGQTHEISTESLRGLGEWGWDISQDVIAHEADIATNTSNISTNTTNISTLQGQVTSSWLSRGSAAPTTGAHVIGEVVFNTNPVAGGNVGWVCTASATPGTWKEFGLISL
jgi:hypothetical protein